MVFIRRKALQIIDMNQDNYLEEAFKITNVLEEFLQRCHLQSRQPTILGLREHIFTGSVSSLAWFRSNQETSFVTIRQRILTNSLKGVAGQPRLVVPVALFMIYNRWNGLSILEYGFMHLELIRCSSGYTHELHGKEKLYCDRRDVFRVRYIF
ncbi:putative callose synthase 7 isoform X4 [Iris pallida]|uniref:Callose synthase 7 isoform X4 n=1 Tax=Iris pallida TaxID=29817 RepID=A0AAX6G3I6_IRIPA|nr:putative callose synthase 7 isoform X4 [Iris pallida]KAJ6822925.1 putative callose synthase 7 isoform X4 [Iris pallida]